jgi:hypothetical protein
MTKTGQGRCLVTEEDDDLVYARFGCTDDMEGCQGPFKLEGGVLLAWVQRVTRRVGVLPPAWVWRVPPYAIGSVAMFRVIQRMAAF